MVETLVRHLKPGDHVLIMSNGGFGGVHDRLLERLRAQPTWDKPELVALFNHMIPEFQHKDTGKYLDSRM